MIAISPVQIEPDPIAIDPRPCLLCGLLINRHAMIDEGEGPIFYCPDLSPDEMDLDELERRAELIRKIEVAEILARWAAADAIDPPANAPPPRKPEPYRPAASTVAAFKYVVSLGNPDHLKRWLLEHPADAPTLLKILDEGK